MDNHTDLSADVQTYTKKNTVYVENFIIHCFRFVDDNC